MSCLAACAAIAGIELPPPVQKGVDLGNGLHIVQSKLTLEGTCRGTGSASDLTLENSGEADQPYTVTVPDEAPVGLGDGTGTAKKLDGKLPARHRVSIPVHAVPTTAGEYAGKATVHIGDLPDVDIELDVTIQGVVLTVFPSVVDFGEVRQGTTPPVQTISIKNTGTVPVQVTGFDVVNGAGGDFTITPPPARIDPDPNQATPTQVSFASGTAGPPLTATLRPKIDSDSLCTDLPTVTLNGARVNQDATISPTAINFGEVDCDSPGGASQNITISNYADGSRSATIGPLAAGSRFSLSETNVTVPPQKDPNTPGTKVVTVTQNAIQDQTAADLKAYSEDIKIHVDGVGATPLPRDVTIAATLTSVGAVVGIAPTVRTFSTIGGSTDTESVTINNTGTKFIYLHHVITGPGAGTFSTGDDAVFPGLPATFKINFSASSDGTYAATITTSRADSPFLSILPTSSHLCNAPAPDVDVTGTRTTPSTGH
jgi:hypothetical protein